LIVSLRCSANKALYLKGLRVSTEAAPVTKKVYDGMRKGRGT
jgi:hypothetical protein